ncbi:MAG: hypothetical protein U0271_37660 [Polyangiaceae bacterium]
MRPRTSLVVGTSLLSFMLGCRTSRDERADPPRVPTPLESAAPVVDPCSEAEITRALASLQSPAPETAPAPRESLGELLAPPFLRPESKPEKLDTFQLRITTTITSVTRPADMMPLDVSYAQPPWAELESDLPERARPLAAQAREARAERVAVAGHAELRACVGAVSKRLDEREHALEKVLRELEPTAPKSSVVFLWLADMEWAEAERRMSETGGELDLTAPLARLASLVANSAVSDRVGWAARYEQARALSEAGAIAEAVLVFREVAASEAVPVAFRADALFRIAANAVGAVDAVPAFRAAWEFTAVDPAKLALLRGASAFGWFFHATKLGDAKDVAQSVAALVSTKLVDEASLSNELGERLGDFLSRHGDWESFRALELPREAVAAAAMVIAEQAVGDGAQTLAQRSAEIAKRLSSDPTSADELLAHIAGAALVSSEPRPRAEALLTACSDLAHPTSSLTLTWSPETRTHARKLVVSKVKGDATAFVSCLEDLAPVLLWDAPGFSMPVDIVWSR